VRDIFRNEKGWASLIAIMIALGLVMVFYLMYLGGIRNAGNSGTAGQIPDAQGFQGVMDASSPVKAYEATRGAIQAINERNQNRDQDLMREIEQMQQY